MLTVVAIPTLASDQLDLGLEAQSWPGGMRVGRILRFSEADTDLVLPFFCCAFNTAAAGAGRIQS